MIVVGAGTHKDTHTAVAVDGATGQALGELTAPARRRGHVAHLDWARGLADGDELVWAIEDCRHVSGGLERFLVDAGERVVRIPPKLMGASRKGARTRGKSDPIDATNVARAALREGVDNLPGAFLDEEAMQIKLLADHREDLVRSRAQQQQRLRWHLHEIDPDYAVPAAALDRIVWIERLSRRLARQQQDTRVLIAREPLHRIAVTQGRVDERAKAYLAKKQAEGRSRMESLRSLKRHLARRVWQALRVDAAPDPLSSDSLKLRPAEVLALT